MPGPNSSDDSVDYVRRVLDRLQEHKGMALHGI